jgi:polysaccharide biosynthesis/export protein
LQLFRLLQLKKIMPKKYSKILFYVLSVIVFSSCITSRTVNYMQKPGIFIPRYKDSISFEDYKLRKGDRIYITVYSTDEKNNLIFNGTNSSRLMDNNSLSANDLYTYLIKENGCINLPVVGEVKVEGKTVREATVEVEKAIDPIFKFNPSVDIKIAERYFSIVGNSANGLIQMPKEKINIFQALAMAGDIGIYGDKSKIRILRETPNGTVLKTFDVRSEDIVHTAYFYVEPNDVIYVQNLDKQFFSVINVPSLFSVVVSTVSFGIFVYDLVVTSSE